MKLANPRLLFVFAGALALAGTSGAFAANATRSPTFLTPPAIPDGSNASRAPFPAKRVFDDVKPIDGQAISPDLPPNTPSTEQRALPPPRVAIMQRPASTEPALTPTGPVSISAAAAADATRITPGVRVMAFESRDTLLTELNGRADSTIAYMNANRDIMKDLTAAPRDRFKDAVADVEQRERALRHSIKEAKKADSGEWESARAQVATDYEAFGAAAANFDAVFAELKAETGPTT